MKIKEIYINQAIKWDEAVKKVDNYDVFYLNSYLKAFSLKGNDQPILFVYSSEDDYAVNAVFRRDVASDKKFIGKIPEGQFFDLISPYGYGGWIGNVSNHEALIIEWNNYCVKRGYICEFVRFELFTKYHEFFDGEKESKTHNVIRSLDLPIDDIWMDFKQKVRKNVKRANTYNLHIILDKTGEYLDDFLRIYYLTMDRTDADDNFYFNKEFFETLNQMRENIMYFHVVYHDEQKNENKIISTELVIYGAETCYSYLGGTDREYFDMRPNDFLKYEVIKWGHDKGLKNFVLGGGYGADDGIFQYKKNLAPNGIVNFYIGRKIFDRQKYSYLVELRKKDDSFNIDSKFFPLYRA